MLRRLPFRLAAALLFSRTLPAGAVVLGGGLTRSDCTIAFVGVEATNGESAVICHDGDPTCDLDGAADGVCHFDVSLCAHLSSAGCTAAAVTSATVAGLPLPVPKLPAAAKKCGLDEPVSVAMDTAVGATAVARENGELKDVDYLDLCCRGTSEPLEAPLCALAVDLSVASCRHPPGKALQRIWSNARTLVGQGAADPSNAHQLLRRALRALGGLKARAHAQGNVCGDTLSLIVGHAMTAVRGKL